MDFKCGEFSLTLPHLTQINLLLEYYTWYLRKKKNANISWL